MFDRFQITKKQIIIGGIALALIVALAIILFLSARKGEISPPNGSDRTSFPSAGFSGAGSGAGYEGGGFPFYDSEAGLGGVLVQLSKKRVSGAAFASSTAVRYIERQTGNIYEVSPKGENKKRISNTTVLKVFEGFWSPDANQVVMRYLEGEEVPFKVKNFSAAINGARGEIEGVFLPDNIAAISSSPYSNKIFYLVESEKGSYGIVSDFTNEERKTVFAFPFGEFNAEWISPNFVSLLTRPSYKARGYLYLLDIRNGRMDRVIGAINGLAARVSPDITKVFYSESRGMDISAKVFDISSRQSRDLGLKTLPDKCVWSRNDTDILYCAVPNFVPSGHYPDDWYMGKLSFDDSIWKIDISTGEAKNILQKSNFDIVNPVLSSDDSYIIFMNKKDSSLWSLKIGE